jgi:GNAT superfamily N-acetyltransferase
MRKAWAAAGAPSAAGPASVVVRALSQADGAALGGLMWRAFHGSVDDWYADPAAAHSDVAKTLTGRWGPVIWSASLAAELDSAIISAVIVVLDQAHENVPLLAFAMTDPGWQRRGIGQHLIEESVCRLDALGLHELRLAVTRGNPAFNLYRRLGFEVIPA